MSEEPLPALTEDRAVLRAWKRAIRDHGKAHVYQALAPLVLEALARVDDGDLGSPGHGERFGRPRDRAAKAALVIEHANWPTGSPDALVRDNGHGLRAPGSLRLRAAWALIEAMSAPSRFHVAVMECVRCLAESDPELVERAAAAL
jgi:hypothetical protein